MPTPDITEDPSNLAYDIKRSVPYDSIAVIWHVLVLTRGDEVMTCHCTELDDALVTVSNARLMIEGCFSTNQTDEITRAWSR